MGIHKDAPFGKSCGWKNKSLDTRLESTEDDAKGLCAEWQSLLENFRECSPWAVERGSPNWLPFNVRIIPDVIVTTADARIKPKRLHPSIHD